MTHERTEEADVVRAEVKRVIGEVRRDGRRLSSVPWACDEILRRLGLEEKGGN